MVLVRGIVLVAAVLIRGCTERVEFGLVVLVGGEVVLVKVELGSLVDVTS